MALYRVCISTTASGTIDVEMPEGTPAKEIAKAALEEGIPSLCVHCSGGRDFSTHSIELGDDLQVEKDSSEYGLDGYAIALIEGE